jgi:large subunit ribosomal protein L25
MPDIVVEARPRADFGKNVNRRLRAQGLIPGVLYGAKKKAVPVAVSPKEIGSILRSASGENTLFDLQLDGSRRKVILKEFQVEPIKSRLLHVDFYEVALDRALEVTVHIELTGVPVGVKVEGGVLDFVTRELAVECLPTDIPAKIVVDVSELALGKHVRVSEIKAPERVKILTDPDVVIAHVVVPRAEEVVAAPEAVAAPAEGEAAAEPEVIKKGKTAAEGEVEEKEKEKPEKKEKK